MTSQVYTGSWGDSDGIIRCQLGEVLHYELGEELEPRREVPIFDKPTRGTSVEKFREMVFNHLKVWSRDSKDRFQKCSLDTRMLCDTYERMCVGYAVLLH